MKTIVLLLFASVLSTSLCATLDFGRVHEENHVQRIHTVRNNNRTRSWNYTLTAPEAPFTLVAGSLSGAIPATSAMNFTFLFSGPTGRFNDEVYSQQLTFSFVSDDGLTDTQTLLLTAYHTVIPTIAVSPSALDFGNIVINHSKTMAVNIEKANQGAIRVQGFCSIEGSDFRFASGDGSFGFSSGSVDILIAFTPSYVNADKDAFGKLIVRAQLGQPEHIIIPLRGHVTAPFPVEVAKEKENSIGTIINELYDSVEMFKLRTVVSWKSSTGVLDDLNGMRIREVVTLHDVLTSAQFRTVDEFPNGCSSTQSPVIYLPKPWTASSPRESPYVSSFKIVKLYKNAWRVYDGHGNENPIPPFEPARYSIEQEYQWTAPWKRDRNNCPIWTPMLTDVITKEVYLGTVGSDGVPFWFVKVKSEKAGEKVWPLGGLSYAAPLSAISADDLPLGGPMPQMHTLRLGWQIPGTLQEASSPFGPWKNVEGVTSKSFLDVPVLRNSGQLYFRLVPD